jgi:hypothetical protein
MPAGAGCGPAFVCAPCDGCGSLILILASILLQLRVRAGVAGQKAQYRCHTMHGAIMRRIRSLFAY